MLIFGTTDISDAADNRYRYPISDRINNAISVAGFLDLVISPHPEVGRYRATATVT